MREELHSRLEAVRSREGSIPLDQLEELYTTGCAEILELEAQALRLGRSRASIDLRIAELREDLRHVRTATEWLREQAEARSAG